MSLASMTAIWQKGRYNSTISQAPGRCPTLSHLEFRTFFWQDSGNNMATLGVFAHLFDSKQDKFDASLNSLFSSSVSRVFKGALTMILT
jgi:hypothetical protein